MGALAFIVIMTIAVSRARARGTAKVPWRVWIWAWRILLPFMCLAVLAGLGMKGRYAIPLLIAANMAPVVILNRVLVPLGWPWVSFWVARCCRPLESTADGGSNAALYAAQAFSYRPPSAATADWLEQKLKQARRLRGSGIVAAGLLAAQRADRERARALLRIADTMPSRCIDRRARGIARDWLVVDAVQIEYWRKVSRFGRRGWGSRRWSYAMARLAERLAGEPRACRNWLLVLLWLAAPRRLWTLPLLRRAAATPRIREAASTEIAGAGDLPRALADLAQLLGSPFSVSEPMFRQTVGGVDAALESPATARRVQERLAALGAYETPPVIASIRSRLADLLVPVVEQAPDLASGAEPGATLDRARERVRARLFRDIEAQSKDYSERQRDEKGLDMLAEWRVWAATRQAAERLVELDPGAQQAMFFTLYAPANNFAVFQQNRRKQPILALEIYRWLLSQARDNAAATDLLKRNIRASAAQC
jgi:hypothetical protein